jgi:tetratricopeptide (TPR) repeat protein
MSALRRVWFTVRRLFRGWEKLLAANLRAVGRSLAWLWAVAWGWGRARKWVYLAQGLPALLAAICAIVLAGLWLALPAHELAARYQDRANSASRAKDFSTALVCYERLATLGKDRPDNLYELGNALANQGEVARAIEIMEQLAPDDRNGYGPAHFQLAIYNHRNLADPQNRKRAELHLNRALQAGLTGIEGDWAHAILGELYARSSKLELAETHFDQAVKTRPQVRLMYAEVLQVQGKAARATEEAKRAVKYFKTLAEADIRNLAARIGWAHSAAFLTEYAQALAILDDAYHVTNEPAYLKAKANIVADWHQHMVRTRPNEVGAQWTLLERGLLLDNTNERLLQRLVQLMGSKDDATQARALMHKVLVGGEATATAHFLLGMDAWTQGQAEQARIHWERANALAPNLPMVANNLAWVLANGKDPANLPRALELSQHAVEKLPQEPSFRDTRARVLMKMQRWEDALPDLEWVLARQPDYPGLRVALAEVYERLRMPAEAAEHRRAAREQEQGKKKGAS